MLAEGLKALFQNNNFMYCILTLGVNIGYYSDNHIITSLLLYAAYKNDFLISDFSFFFVTLPSQPSVFQRGTFTRNSLQILKS